MARIIKTIEIEGQPAVALFDSGAVYTYVRSGLLAGAPRHPMSKPVRVVLGGRNIQISELCFINGKIEGLDFSTYAVPLDDPGYADGHRLDSIVGALTMEQWEIRLDPKTGGLDLEGLRRRELTEYREVLDPGTHRISIRFTPASRAKAKFLFLRFPLKVVVSGEKFGAAFHGKNLAPVPFPGGRIAFLYKSPVHVHSASVSVPRLEPGQGNQSDEVELKAAGIGDSGIFCELTSLDGNSVECAGEDTALAQCIGYSDNAVNKPQFLFQIHSYDDINARYRQNTILIIAALSLAVSIVGIIIRFAN